MGIVIEDLSTLDADEVKQNLDEINTRLQEENSTLTLIRGVIRDLVSGNHAILSTAEQATLERYLSARSLQQIEADPTLADDDVVDDIMSNYGVARKEGSAAVGDVTIILSQDNTVVLAEGSIFEAEGKQFTADEVFTAKTEPEQIQTSGDRLLTALADGTFAFTISVTAVEEGVDSEIAKDTALIPAILVPNFVRSFATSDFVNGRDVETNTELLTRFQEGIACKAPSNRVNMKALLATFEEFANVLRSSITGFGDEEMLRDQHTIFPMSFGGTADWFVRTQARLLRSAIVKEATLIEIGDGYGIWQFGIGRDEAPGFYEIDNVRLPGAEEVAGGFEITLDERNNDLTGSGFIPDIQTIEEGAYSRFQSTVIRFKDTVTDHSGLVETESKQEYSVEVRMMPLIGEIQDAMSAFDVRAYGSDVLVRAPVPVFMTLSFTISKKNNAPDPDLDGIANALAAEVNNVEFTGRLAASQLHDVIHGFLDTASVVGNIDMFGRIRYPDGTRKFVRSSEVIEINGPAEQQVSSRTVQFFLDPEDVAIAVNTDIPVPA
jgi:hypothetical protein